MKLRRFRKTASVLVAAAMMLGLSACVAQETGLVFSDDCETVTMYSETAIFELLETNGETESEYSKDTEGSQSVLVWDLAGVSAGTEPELVISAKFAAPKAAFPLVAVIIIASVIIVAAVIVVVALNVKKNSGAENSDADYSAEEENAVPSVQEKLAQTEDEGAIPVQEEAVTEEKKPEYCEICGMKLNGIDKFCPGCGEKV